MRGDDGRQCHAVFDVGTNSVKMLVAALTGGRVESILHRVRITRMGSGLVESGRISDAGVERTAEAMHELLGLAREWEPEQVMGVGLEAFRRASNGSEVAGRIHAMTGVPVTILPGVMEARLSREAVMREWGQEGESRLLTIDIGGASTELALSHPSWEASLPVGVVTCSEEIAGAAGVPAGRIQELARQLRETVALAWSRRNPGVERLRGVAVGGTATTCATMLLGWDGEELGQVHGFDLQRVTVRGLRDRLATMSREERRAVPGLHPLREPVIVAGLTLLEVIMGVCGLEVVRVSVVDLLHAVFQGVAEGRRDWT